MSVLKRGDLELLGPCINSALPERGQGFYLHLPQTRFLSPDDLRWLCQLAGPALLNELAKDSPTTLDIP